MKKLLRLAGFALLAIVAAAALGLVFLVLRRPAQRVAPVVAVERTPERVQRGEYLAKHVVGCAECHSVHLRDRYAFPVLATGTLSGDLFFTKKDGFPGVLASPNLTPDAETGIGTWTDGEVLRAMREGVSRDGHALFPMMPYEAYRSLSDEDAFAVVAYLRSVGAVRHVVPKRELPLLLSLLIKSAPQPLQGPVSSPPASDPVAYGQYLTTVCGCRGCHTPVDGRHRPIPGREFSGGQRMDLPEKQHAVTANITPHPDTFMGKATREEFVGRFRSFASLEGEKSPVAPKGRNTPMPWIGFSGMSEADLSAIYAYLKTVTPIANKVEPFPDAPGGARP